jgi:hypothetical protein
MIRLGVPTPSITRATSEWTGAISTATFGTSAEVVPARRAAVTERGRSLLDIGTLM